jgi:hypothetical protein
VSYTSAVVTLTGHGGRQNWEERSAIAKSLIAGVRRAKCPGNVRGGRSGMGEPLTGFRLPVGNSRLMHRDVSCRQVRQTLRFTGGLSTTDRHRGVFPTAVHRLMLRVAMPCRDTSHSTPNLIRRIMGCSDGSHRGCEKR